MEKIYINGSEKLNIINESYCRFDSKKMKLHYFMDADVVDTATCPTFLPENDMELTKHETL